MKNINVSLYFILHILQSQANDIVCYLQIFKFGMKAFNCQLQSRCRKVTRSIMFDKYL